MATAIVMPRQGNTVESCTIVQWHKSKGDRVAQGEVLFTYETDKASFEFPSPVSGTLLDVFFDTDVDIPVLTTVAVVGEPGENYDNLRPTAATPSSGSVVLSPAAVGSENSRREALSEEPKETGSGVKAHQEAIGVSPRARAAAEKYGVDTSRLSGSGPHGRVIERDVREGFMAGAPRLTPAAAAKAADTGMQPPAQGSGIGGRVRMADLSSPVSESPVVERTLGTGASVEYTEAKLSKIRSIIAERMTASLQQAAQLTMNVSADASSLLAYRARVKARAQELGLNDINITDMVAFALVRVLLKHPELNATIEGDIVRQYHTVHLALAVDTPRGLMVPVVRGADRLSLNDLAGALKNLARQCQDGSINPDMLSGGTITLSNIGSYGIESFTPIINRPQVAILGLNTIMPRPVAGEGGDYRMVPHIGLSLTIDHRAVDGAPAARFLRALVKAIENFELTLAG